MVVIKNQDWNYYKGELYKNYANQHQAETTLTCCDMPLSPLKVHGLILSANSEWFELILKGRYNREVPLPYKKNVMLPLIDIIYKGSADVAPHIVQELFNAACGLEIKGLNYDSVNFVVKGEVLDKPGLSTSSPSPLRKHQKPKKVKSSKIRKIESNNARGPTLRRTKNINVPRPITPLSPEVDVEENKAEALGESNDSYKTAIGSDDEVLLDDNGVTSDIDMVDDASRHSHRKHRSPKKIRLNRTEFKASKIREIESNDASGSTLRSTKNDHVPRPTTLLSSEVDVEASSPLDLRTQPKHEHTTADTSDESAIRPVEPRLKTEIEDKILNGHLKDLTQLCVICYKNYTNFSVHKNKHKPTLMRNKIYICRNCSKKFKIKRALDLHTCSAH